MVLTIVRSVSAPPGTSELVSLNATAPTGITVSYLPSSPVTLQASANLNVTLDIVASATAATGNDTITIQGVSGTNTQSATFTLRVVQYRVVMFQSTFIPAKLNVTAGSTVYWQNLDGAAGGCGSSGAGPHNVVFTTLSGANSSTIKQFGIYSYTFTTPGSYFYYSSLDPDHVMNGTITVTAASGGGMGMVSRMPSFSYFKGGTPALTPSHSATTRASSTQPFGAIASGVVVLAGLLMLSVSLTTLSGLRWDVGLGLLISLLAVALTLEASTEAKRKLTVLSNAVFARIFPQ